MNRDYLTVIDPQSGIELDAEIPATCPDCDRPTYYDYDDEQYHHAFDTARGCFLIPAEDRPNDYRHPITRTDLINVLVDLAIKAGVSFR